jgi:hypothetical protein
VKKVLLLFSLFVVLAWPAAEAGAATPLEIAAQDDPVFLGPSTYDRERALQQSRDMGVTRIRINASWYRYVKQAGDKTPPKVPLYDWSRIDSLVDAAARYGIRVQMTLTGQAPAFATSNRKIGNYGPKGKLFGDFARAAAKHFKGRVDRYSIWNEPNYISWLAPFDLNAALYRELYTAAYTQIKRADPAAQVLIGETAPYAINKRSTAPLEFLRNVTCVTKPGGDKKGADGSGTDPTPPEETAKVQAARVSAKPPKLVRGACKPLKADGFAHHPYDYRHRPDYAYHGADNATLGSIGRLTGTLQELKQLRVLRTPKGRTLPIYLTEYGYFNSGKYALADGARSAYLKKAWTIAQRDTSVAQILQYGLVTPQADSAGAYFDLSLLRPDGSATLAYNSLVTLARAPGGRAVKPVWLRPVSLVVLVGLDCALAGALGAGYGGMRRPALQAAPLWIVVRGRRGAREGAKGPTFTGPGLVWTLSVPDG